MGRSPKVGVPTQTTSAAQSFYGQHECPCDSPSVWRVLDSGPYSRDHAFLRLPLPVARPHGWPERWCEVSRAIPQDGPALNNVTVTSGPKKFHSSTKTKGSYKATPHTKGTYRIVCTIHAGMKMTLKVR